MHTFRDFLRLLRFHAIFRRNTFVHFRRFRLGDFRRFHFRDFRQFCFREVHTFGVFTPKKVAWIGGVKAVLFNRCTSYN